MSTVDPQVVAQQKEAAAKSGPASIVSLEHGTRTVGVVSSADSGMVRVNNSPLVTLTVHYKDSTGQDRWVTKKRVFPPTSVPRVGDTYTVWYDQSDPGNESRIVLASGDVSTADADSPLPHPRATAATVPAEPEPDTPQPL